MKGLFATLFVCFGWSIAIANPESVSQQATVLKESKNVQIVIETSMGAITAELYVEKAPATVSNMLAYIESNFYKGTIFHRVIDGFMIQGGGFTSDMMQKKTNSPVKNEADNGLRNTRGTLAMARTAIVDSATSQFFINLVDNGSLDFTSKTDNGYGYCVFGKVIEGLAILDKIAKTPTGFSGRHQNVPVEPIFINTIRYKTDAVKAKMPE